MTNKKYIQYGPEGSNKCTESVESFTKSITDQILEQGVGNVGKWEFEVIEMADESYNNLPEFLGF